MNTQDIPFKTGLASVHASTLDIELKVTGKVYTAFLGVWFWATCQNRHNGFYYEDEFYFVPFENFHLWSTRTPQKTKYA